MPALFRMIAGVILALAALQSPQATSAPDETLATWIAHQPIMRSGLISGESHYYQTSTTARTNVAECFAIPAISGRTAPCAGRLFIEDKPRRGTWFRSGLAKTVGVYDASSRRLLLTRWCCSYGETLLLDGVGPPPKKLAKADLQTVKTESGLRLGDSPTDVERKYGKRKVLIRSRDSHFTALYYTHTRHNACVGDTSFVFRDGKLAAISIWNGC